MSNSLSYILSTYNKLPYLKITIPALLDSLEEVDELIVIDGGSVDGTMEYLGKLYQENKKFFFISEKDKGEAHGFNKGVLLANCDLIKIITDDDAFNFPVIKKCKDFMLHHPEIDIMAGNTGGIRMENIKSLYCSFSFQDDFELWKKGSLKNFFFNGTCLMIRKSSLELTGLFSTSSLLADMEFSLRVTGVARIAWCTGIIATRILNSQSNNIKFAEEAKIEDKKLCQFYDYKHSHIRRKEELKNRSTYRKIRSRLSRLKASFVNRNVNNLDIFTPDNKVYTFEEVHDYCMQWMTSHELNKEIKFLIKE
jgi:glycosyltransferase involved in cell wall biosynthesis